MLKFSIGALQAAKSTSTTRTTFKKSSSKSS